MKMNIEHTTENYYFKYPKLIFTAWNNVIKKEKMPVKAQNKAENLQFFVCPIYPITNSRKLLL